jgi:hypothetical protein
MGGEHARATLVVEWGRHHVGNVGGEFFGATHLMGDTASLMAVGARLNLDLIGLTRGPPARPRRWNGVHFGGFLLLRKDLSSTTLSVTGQSCFIGCEGVMGTYRVGGWFLAGGLTMTFDFHLSRIDD